MQQNWTQRSEKTLEQIRERMEKTDQDRLELVRVMRFAFGALGQSLGGWMQWINSPEVMSTFTREELDEMARNITEMVEKFVAFDIEVTNQGMNKGLAKQRAENQQNVRFVI
ncbi:MAG TPA: DUF2153 family protein [Patescibacteria group bacterium]|nr:DUF2153 family protein [Patescibacteria group bacterium]